jgi:hypothetical protein
VTIDRSKLALPSSDAPVELADWLEATMLVLARSRLTYGEIRDWLQNTVFPSEGTASDQLNPDDLELGMDNLFGELVRRKRICGRLYPFLIERGAAAVQLDPNAKGLAYPFLLLISVSLAFRAERRYREIDRAFDMLTLCALRAYCGQASKGLRFGSPASDGRPRYFDKAIPWLRGQLGLQPGDVPPGHHTGDAGADVVTWIPFKDEREAFVIILSQCTVEIVWQNKAYDIKPLQWRNWISWGELPMSCLAIPFAIPLNYNKWDQVRTSAHIVLERLRLVQFSARPDLDLSLQMLDWTTRELTMLGAQEVDHILRLADADTKQTIGA